MGRPVLHLVPAPLDFGVTPPAGSIVDGLGHEVVRVAAGLRHWVVENARTARAVLGRVQAVQPLAAPLQELSIVELPRPAKGPAARRGVATPTTAWGALLEPMRRGHDLGLMSEAGLPAVADPGASLVAAAHEAGFIVRAHPGPSAIVLALAASGLNGQSFAFVGYLPVDAAARAERLRDLDRLARRTGQSQVVIETPYRNPALLDAMLLHLEPTTRLAVSMALSTPDAWTRSDRVGAWRERPTPLATDRPAVFSFGPG